jgi:Ion transport protein
MLLISLAVCAIVPFTVVFKPPYGNEGYYNGTLLAFNGVFMIDIIFNMLSATYDARTGEEINQPMQIAKNYTLSFKFLVDLGCMIPWNQFGFHDYFKFLELIKLLRLFRLAPILQSFNVKPRTKIVSTYYEDDYF